MVEFIGHQSKQQPLQLVPLAKWHVTVGAFSSRPVFADTDWTSVVSTGNMNEAYVHANTPSCLLA